MKNSLISIAILLTSFVAKAATEPVPVPNNIRVEGSGPREKIWNLLSENEKRFTYHLYQAGQAARSLIYHQNHRHALKIKGVLVEAFETNNTPTTKALLGADGTKELMNYSALFFENYGPYTTSGVKRGLKVVTAAQVDELFKMYGPNINATDRADIVKLMTDGTYELIQRPDDAIGTGLETAGGNLYEKGITGAEVLSAMDQSLKSDLNCRIVRGVNGLKCELQSTETKGVVGTTLKKIVQQLRMAKNFALSQLQKDELEYFIRYFETGTIDDFRAANIAWVKDGTESKVDFMTGWVEVYEDWLAKIGSWETYIQVVDPQVSRVAKGLATHAQAFENQMPYQEQYKKKFPDGYAPPAIMAYYFSERSSFRSGGYNLPNFDDIRRDIGFKNVIKLQMPGVSDDPITKQVLKEWVTEFGPASKVDELMQNQGIIWNNIVLLHEIIGHGSGTYNTAKYGANEDPISALGVLGSSLEEQRADCAAMSFVGNPILIEVGIYQDAAHALKVRNLVYDYYLVDFLRRFAVQRSFTEAHQRGHWLFVNKLLESGAIAWESKDGSTMTDQNRVLVVKDYDKYYQTSVAVLAELQDIKAERKEAELKTLYEKYAPLAAAQESWAKALVARVQPLKVNAGSVEQPWSIDENLNYHVFGSDTIESIAPYWNK